MIINIEKVASVIREIAQSEILPRFNHLTEGDVATKSSPSDYVTRADKNAEAALAGALKDIYPQAAFVGEEGASVNAITLDILKSDGPAWVVDPLDGTRNFVEGRSEYACIVALVEKNEIRAGWIYAIPDDKFLIASKGDGAMWGGESAPARKIASRPLKGLRALGAFNPEMRQEILARLKANFETETVRCSAYAYIRLVLGMRHFALYSRANPWDHAAGILALNETGGCARYVDDNSDYTPIAVHGRPLLVAGGEAIWRAVSGKLK